MMRNILSLSVLLSFMSLSVPAAAEPIVATVGGKAISLKEFNEKYEEVRRQTINPPPREVFLEDLVRYEVGLLEADKKGIEKDPIVKERIRQEVYKGLIEKEIGDKIKEIKVNEKEMKSYYKNNPEVRTSHILVEFKPDANEQEKKAAKKRAEEIFSEVKKSKRPFEELVALYSDDVLSKKNGGDVGWQSRMTLVPSYYEAALNTKVGKIHGLVETQYGFHIIKVTGRNNYKDANKRQIRAAVFDEKRKNIFDNYFKKLKDRYKIQLNKSVVK